MSSTLFVVPEDKMLEWETWPGAVTFTQPVKGVFGRVLCDTDGSIGDPTGFSPETALQIVEQCKALTNKRLGDARGLDKVRRWAAAGQRLYAVWRH